MSFAGYLRGSLRHALIFGAFFACFSVGIDWWRGSVAPFMGYVLQVSVATVVYWGLGAWLQQRRTRRQG